MMILFIFLCSVCTPFMHIRVHTSFNQDLYNVMLLMLLMSDADDDDDSDSLTGCIILVWIMRFCETEYINICLVCSSSRRESLLSGRSQYTERLLLYLIAAYFPLYFHFSLF